MGGPRAKEGGPCPRRLVPPPQLQSAARSSCWPGLQFHEEGPPPNLVRLCRLAPARRGQKWETRLGMEPQRPRGLQGHLARWGTISRPDYQCPSGSTSHKNRKNWDKILHLPLIVSAQLFPRRDAIRQLHGCSCALAWSAPPDSQRREGDREAMPSGRAQTTAHVAARRRERP